MDPNGGDGGTAGTLGVSGSLGVSGTFGTAGSLGQGGTFGVAGSTSSAGHGGLGGSSTGGTASHCGSAGTGTAGTGTAGTGASVGGGTGTEGCSHLQPGSTVGLKVQYKVNDPGASVAYIFFAVEIDNGDDMPISLTDLHLRYYFNNDLTTPLTDFYSPQIRHANGNTENLDANSVKATYTPTYLEITFTSSLELQMGENVNFQVHMHSDPSPGMHTQGSDYSFNAAASAFTPSCKLVLMEQTAIVWGTPPP